MCLRRSGSYVSLLNFFEDSGHRSEVIVHVENGVPMVYSCRTHQQIDRSSHPMPAPLGQFVLGGADPTPGVLRNRREQAERVQFLCELIPMGRAGCRVEKFGTCRLAEVEHPSGNVSLPGTQRTWGAKQVPQSRGVHQIRDHSKVSRRARFSASCAAAACSNSPRAPRAARHWHLLLQPRTDPRGGVPPLARRLPIRPQPLFDRAIAGGGGSSGPARPPPRGTALTEALTSVAVSVSGGVPDTTRQNAADAGHQPPLSRSRETAGQSIRRARPRNRRSRGRRAS